jgi:hypothetical protein
MNITQALISDHDDDSDNDSNSDVLLEMKHIPVADASSGAK